MAGRDKYQELTNLRFTTTSYGSKVDFDEFFGRSGDDTTMQHFDGPFTNDDAFLDNGYNLKFGREASTSLLQLDACMQNIYSLISCSSADQVYSMQSQNSGNGWRESKGTKLFYKNLSSKYGTVSMKPPTDTLFKKIIVYSDMKRVFVKHGAHRIDLNNGDYIQCQQGSKAAIDFSSSPFDTCWKNRRPFALGSPHPHLHGLVHHIYANSAEVKDTRQQKTKISAINYT